jgi:hypothetical protein
MPVELGLKNKVHSRELSQKLFSPPRTLAELTLQQNMHQPDLSLALSPPNAAERRLIILADGRGGAKSDARAMYEYIVLSFKPLSTDISHLRDIRSLGGIRRGFRERKNKKNILNENV